MYKIAFDVLIQRLLPTFMRSAVRLNAWLMCLLYPVWHLNRHFYWLMYRLHNELKVNSQVISLRTALQTWHQDKGILIEEPSEIFPYWKGYFKWNGQQPLGHGFFKSDHKLPLGHGFSVPDTYEIDFYVKVPLASSYSTRQLDWIMTQVNRYKLAEKRTALKLY